MNIDEKTNALSQSVEIKLSEVQLNRGPVINAHPVEKYKAKMSIKTIIAFFVIMLFGSLPVLLYPEKPYLIFLLPIFFAIWVFYEASKIGKNPNKAK